MLLARTLRFACRLIFATTTIILSAHECNALTLRWDVDQYWVDRQTPFNGFCRILWGPGAGNYTFSRDLPCTSGQNTFTISNRELPANGLHVIAIRAVGTDSAGRQVESDTVSGDSAFYTATIEPHQIAAVGNPIKSVQPVTIASLFPGLTTPLSVFTVYEDRVTKKSVTYNASSYDPDGGWAGGDRIVEAGKGFLVDNPSDSAMKVTFAGRVNRAYPSLLSGYTIVAVPDAETCPLGYTGLTGSHQFPAVLGDVVSTFNSTNFVWSKLATFKGSSGWSDPAPSGPSVFPGQALMLYRR